MVRLTSVVADRLFPHGSPVDVDLGALVRQSEARGDDYRVVKQLFNECAQPMSLSQDSEDSSQHDETMQEPVMLPAYLRIPTNEEAAR